MNWEQIHKRVRERLSEYSRGAAESPLRATFNAQTIYDRMTEVYRDILTKVQERSSDKLEVTEPLTYTANTESMTLPAVVQRRPLLGVIRVLQTGAQEPLEVMTRAQYDEWLRRFDAPNGTLIQPYGTLRYFLDGQTKIRLVPKPAQAITLTLRYVATVSDLTAPTYDANGAITVPGDSAGTPTLLPDEHHATIALGTAASFIREVGGNDRLEAELANKITSLMRWADWSPQDGPRYVHEEF